VLRRVWRRGGIRGMLARPALWLCRRTGTFVADAGDDLPYEMTHTVTPCAAARGIGEMAWTRILHFPAGRFRCEGDVTFDPTRRVLVERLGPCRRLEAELHCTVRQGELHTVSGRQWLHLGPLRLRIPRLLAGRATLREWQREDGSLGTVLTIRNPLLGDFLGWEGWFRGIAGQTGQTDLT
jgi:hypothetical protein